MATCAGGVQWRPTREAAVLFRETSQFRFNVPGEKGKEASQGSEKDAPWTGGRVGEASISGGGQGSSDWLTCMNLGEPAIQRSGEIFSLEERQCQGPGTMAAQR